MSRKAEIERKSKETQIKVSLNVDGTGKTKIKTPIGFLDHMLELFAFHGYFDLDLSVSGDTHIDIHHTNEDIGIALGKAFKKALGDNNLGIKRFGSAFAPMEDALGHTVIDISGRGHFKINCESPKKSSENYTFEDYKHFLESFAKQLGANVIVTIKNTEFADVHTTLETAFKSLGMALDQATTIDSRRKGQVPSTKGIID
jgi:imidazoleglycerol-phosphate dehydratase